MGELNLSALFAEKPAKVRFTSVARYPAVSYDLAMIVSEDVTAEQIVKIIKKAGGKLLKETQIFDVYRGANIPEGQKSVAVKVVYQSAEKTLSEDDIMPHHTEIISQLRKAIGATLRDS